MHIFKTPLAAAALGISALGLTFSSATAQSNQTIPVDVWALRSVVNAVQVSPDGKHLMVHKVESREGEYVLEIYKTDNLSKPYRRLNGDKMELISANWVNDNFIFGTAWQVVRKKVRGPEDDVRERATYAYNLETNSFSRVSGNFSIVGLLPDEPDKVLVQSGNPVNGSLGVDPFAAFRPRAYNKFDLNLSLIHI